MGLKTKRIINAFLIGFTGTLITLGIDHYQDFSKALLEGNWVWLRSLGASIAVGAVIAGLRAIQSYVGKVPSPEPDESAP